jgi:hypothetical protein
MSQKIGGLKRKWWRNIDPRHFSWKKKFGSVANLPTDDFDVWVPLETKDQGYTNVCTACGVTGAAEPQTGTPNDECFNYAMTKKIAGKVDDQGCDPVEAMLAAIQGGLLNKADSPFHVLTDPVLTFADLKNWPQDKILEAGTKKEISWYKVNGASDIFDSIRTTLAQSRTATFKSPVMVGAYWRPDWLSAPGGIITTNNPSPFTTEHEFKIIGQKTVNGVLHLKAHLSSGTQVGDKGCYYFPREIANAFLFAYAFGPGNPQDYQQNMWNVLQKIYNSLYNIWVAIGQKTSGLFTT